MYNIGKCTISPKSCKRGFDIPIQRNGQAPPKGLEVATTNNKKLKLS